MSPGRHFDRITGRSIVCAGLCDFAHDTHCILQCGLAIEIAVSQSQQKPRENRKCKKASEAIFGGDTMLVKIIHPTFNQISGAFCYVGDVVGCAF